MVLLAQTVKMVPVIDGPELLFGIVRPSIEPFLSIQSVNSALNITIELDKLLAVSWSWSPDADTQQHLRFVYVQSGRVVLGH